MGSFATLVRYPPIWLACVMGACLILTIQPYMSCLPAGPVLHTTPVPALFAIGTALIGMALARGYHELFKMLSLSTDRPVKVEKGDETKTSIADDIEGLHKWMETETPIQTPAQDRLDTRLFANRIARTLMESPKRTVSLVGTYGSGKSSVLNVAQAYLNGHCKIRKDERNADHKPQLILVELCGWGLQRGTAAEYILSHVVKGCAQHFDCLGMANLPGQYAAAMKSFPTWGKALSGLLSPSHDPMETLRKLDRVLQAVDMKLIVFIEDLDRNWQGAEFWTDVMSLLDRLKRLESVSFVLAITETGRLGEVINRLSDYVEVIPRLSVEHVAAIFRLFRDHCLEKYADIRFPVAEDQYQTRIDAGDIKQRNEMMRRLNVRVKEEIDAITAVVDNPRNLKHILRRTDQAWSSLHGEIDFDDLFVANVLRVAATEVFNFVHENLPEIRWLQRGKEDKDDKERKALHESLAKACSLTGPRLQATNELVGILFPYWPSPQLPGMRSTGVIQGVWNPEPTDYWDRFVREGLYDWEIGDQATARAINGWKQNRESNVYQGMTLPYAVNEIPGFAKKIWQFGDLFDGSEIRVLTSQVFEIVFKTKGSTDRDFLGRNELHRLASDKPFSGHGDWLIGEASKLLALNLFLAVDAYQHWFDPTFYEGEAEAKRVRNLVLQKAKSYYSDRGAFIEAIRYAASNAVRDFVLTMSNRQYGGGGSFDPDEWIWLADALMDAAETGDPTVVRQLLRIAITQDVALPSYPLIWSEELVKSFFRDREKELLVLLSNINPDQFDERDVRFAFFARDQASERLSTVQAADGQKAEKELPGDVGSK